VLGIFYGYGYCFLTDLHWEIREKLGYDNPYNSYIRLLLSPVLPVSVSDKQVDTVTGVTFLLALVGSVVTNILDWRKRRVK
jgi:hypothetical protein